MIIYIQVRQKRAVPPSLSETKKEQKTEKKNEEKLWVTD